MRRIPLAAFIAAALLFGQGALFAQRGSAQAEVIEVRIANPLPRESPWGRTLDRLASEWSRVTNNQVRLRVLHGGTEGSEEKMLLSLAANNIQAALFTSFGLSSIHPAIMTMSMPFLIRTDEELNAVFSEVQGDLEARINSGNYFIVAWSNAGFVNFFSREPVFTPDDLRRHRIGSNTDAADLNNAFRSMGFQMVETDWADMAPRMNAGTISAVYLNPPAAAVYQLHTMLRNMLDLNVAPIIGGIVMNQVTWRRIGALNPRYQQDLLNVTRRIAEEFDSSLQRTIDDSIQSMTRAGLVVNRAAPAHVEMWVTEIERTIPPLLGTVYDRELYYKVNEILTRIRAER